MRLLAPILLATLSHAQTLDLGTGPARPDSDVAATALRDRLDADIAAAPRRTDRDLARRRVRALARHLAQRAIDAGSQGDAHLLVAETLALNLRSLDAILANESLVPDARLALLIHDLDVTDRDLPLDPEDLDRFIRDLFAQILLDLPPPAAPSAWAAPDVPALVEPDDALDDDWIDMLARTVSPTAADAVRALRPDVRLALAWPAYRREAADLVRTIEGAVDVIDPRYTWVPAPARDALAGALDEHLRALEDPATRLGALRALEQFDAAARAFERADGLEPGPFTREARGALVQTATSLRVSRLGPRRRLADAIRVLDLLGAGESTSSERDVIRQLRPPHRDAVETLERSREQVIRAVAPILQRQDAIAEPGIVATLGGYRRALDDLGAIERISGALADPDAIYDEPVVRVTRRTMADHLLRLHRGGDPERAIALLRDLDDQLRLYAEFPGEQRLRDAVASADAGTLSGPAQIWADATGFRQNQLVAIIDRRRLAWWDAWDRGYELGDHPTTFHDLDALRMLVRTISWVEIVHAAASTASGRAVTTPLNAWPGFELSPDALGALAPSTVDLAEATRLLVADRPGDAMDVIRRLLDDEPAFVAVARLEIDAADLGLSPDASVLHELASGPPPPPWLAPAWLVDQRADLAAFCRYAEELAALESLDDDARADEARAYVNHLATLIIERLD